jgi:hypothetical protein
MTTSRSWDEIQSRLDARRELTPRPALSFTGIPLEYWQEEVRLGCVASMERLRRIVAERGADYDKTITGLK